MEQYIKNNVSGITYLSELTPHHFLEIAWNYRFRWNREICFLITSKRFFKKWWGDKFADVRHNSWRTTLYVALSAP